MHYGTRDNQFGRATHPLTLAHATANALFCLLRMLTNHIDASWSVYRRAAGARLGLHGLPPTVGKSRRTGCGLASARSDAILPLGARVEEGGEVRVGGQGAVSHEGEDLGSVTGTRRQLVRLRQTHESAPGGRISVGTRVGFGRRNRRLEAGHRPQSQPLLIDALTAPAELQHRSNAVPTTLDTLINHAPIIAHPRNTRATSRALTAVPHAPAGAAVGSEMGAAGRSQRR